MDCRLRFSSQAACQDVGRGTGVLGLDAGGDDVVGRVEDICQLVALCTAGQATSAPLVSVII